MQYENYSVLMSVYYKEKPEYLKQSIESMLNQTVPTNDFVIVCDGPLTPELDEVLENYKKQKPEVFNVARLERNVGIGAAANEGLKYCKNDLVAKMDADDIALTNRCEKELELLLNEDLALVGSYIDEFQNDGEIVSVRKVPTEYSEILKYAKQRDPFNNQTVIYRKSAVLKVGGYSDLKRCEDYDLYVRILAAGYKARNIPESLVKYRLTSDTFERRGNFDNLKGFVIVRWKIHRSGFSGLMDFVIPCVGQIFLSVIPGKFRASVYSKLLRR